VSSDDRNRFSERWDRWGREVGPWEGQVRRMQGRGNTRANNRNITLSNKKNDERRKEISIVRLAAIKNSGSFTHRIFWDGSRKRGL